MKIRWSLFLFTVIASFSNVWGGYLWNGSSSGVYNGTTNWVEDLSLTGKWITSGPVTLTDSQQVLIGENATNSQLTVDGATVETSSGNRIRIGCGASSGTLNIQNGSVTSNGCLWMGNGGQTGNVSILSGGLFHITSPNQQDRSFIGDSEGGKATILVNGGEFSTDKGMIFGHKESAELTLLGGGSFVSTANFYLGGGENDSVASKTGKITVGNAESTGTASFTNLYIGHVASGILDIQQGSVSITETFIAGGKNNADISVQHGELNTSKNLQLTNNNSSEVIVKLHVGAEGTVNVGQVLSSGNHASSKTEITVENGGKIEAKQMTLSEEAGDTILKIDGAGSSVSVNNDYIAFGNRSTGTTNVEITNGGSLKAGYWEGAKSAGESHILVSGEGSLMQMTSVMHSSLNGGSLTVTNQAEAIFADRLYFGKLFNDLTPGQTGTTIQVEVSEGSLLQAGGFWFGQRNNDILVTLSSGGKLYDTGIIFGTMFLGDFADSSATIHVDGGILQVDKILHIGQNGKGTIQVTNGGSLTAGSITVGITSGAKGLLQIVGQDVSIKTTGDFNLNSRNGSALHFLADSTGLGALEVGGKYSQNNGTVALGIAGGMVCWSPEVAAAEYTLLNANEGNDSFKISESSLWTIQQDNRTVQLNEDSSVHFSKILSLNNGMLEIDSAYETMGYLNFTGESGYFNVQLYLDGLDDLAQTAALADWMASEDKGSNVQALDVGVIGLSSLFSADGNGILAWDWGLYNTAYSQDISLIGIAGQNVPEPATWGMFLLGIGFLICQKRKMFSR